ncbi:MAG: hypothetical protein OSJ60_06440 [Lachnospiraceae bacterium]|nr:hypothetical protein [Lachnospiraceae bacterium]
MNISINQSNIFSVLGRQSGAFGMSKSAQDKMERQQKAQNQIDFLENQKANLKNMECDTLEEIARKLEMFHSYEDQIAEVKKAYNNEQMGHVLDEAMEQGEKIAEAAEKTEPKTPEERKKEMAEEALGIDESKGALTESLEEIEEMVSEEMEELEEEVLEQSAKELQEGNLKTAEEMDADNLKYMPFDMRV